MLRSCRSHERLKGSPIVPICVPQFCGLQHLCILASASNFAADNLSVNTFAEILSDDKKYPKELNLALSSRLTLAPTKMV